MISELHLTLLMNLNNNNKPMNCIFKNKNMMNGYKIQKMNQAVNIFKIKMIKMSYYKTTNF